MASARLLVKVLVYRANGRPSASITELCLQCPVMMPKNRPVLLCLNGRQLTLLIISSSGLSMVWPKHLPSSFRSCVVVNRSTRLVVATKCIPRLVSTVWRVTVSVRRAPFILSGLSRMMPLVCLMKVRRVSLRTRVPGVLGVLP